MNVRLLTVLLLLSTLGLLAGCSLFDAEEPALRVSTDGRVYRLGADETIDITVENRSHSVIQFSTCMPTALEELDGDQVVATLGFPVCECICMRDLDPYRVWRYPVHTAWIAGHEDQLAWGSGYSYRFRLDFQMDTNTQEVLDRTTWYTNSFQLVKE